MSSEPKDGSTGRSLKTLAESLDAKSWKLLDDRTKFLVSVYLKWVQSARAHCGTPFIPQSLRSPSSPGHKSSSPMDTSLRAM